MSHYRRDVVGRGISTGLGLGLRRRLSGGALPVLFGWNPEIAQALPATATFTRAFVAQVLTTTDGTTFWYQEAKSGELRLDGLRRVEQIATNADWGGGAPPTNWPNLGGADTGTLTASTAVTGPGANQLRFQCTSQREVIRFANIPVSTGEVWGCAVFVEAVDTVVSGDTRFIEFDNIGKVRFADASITSAGTAGKWICATAQFTGTGTAGVRIGIGGGFNSTGDVTISSPIIFKVQNTDDVFGGWVNDTVEYLNIGVNGVQYFNTTNGNSVDGNGVVTEAAGTTITGGGYLPEPAATNRVLYSDDYVNASGWQDDLLTPTDNGIGSLGLRSSTLDPGTSTGGHQMLTIASIGAPTSTEITVYSIVKAGTGQYFALRGPRGSALFPWGVFDVVNGTLGGTNDLTTSRITALGDDFYKCEITYTTPSTIENGKVVVAVQNTSTASTTSAPISYTAANETIEILQSQEEDTAFSTSPIITSGSTVTRVADTLSIGISEPAAGYTAFCDATGTPVVVGGINPVVYGGAGAGRPIMIDVFTAGNPFSFTSNGISARVTDIDWRNVRLKVSVSVPNDGSSNGIISVTGGTTDTDAENTTSTDALTLGYSVGSANDQFRSPIHNAIIYGIAVDQTQNEALVV